MREPIGVAWSSAKTIYAAFWRGGQVCRINDAGRAWVNYATQYNADAALALTSESIGTGRSLYQYPDGLELLHLEKGFVTDIGRVITVRYYLQAGGSPALQSDSVIHEETLQVQFGHNRPTIELDVQPNLRADLTPEALQLMVTLKSNGKPVDLSAVSGTHLMCFELTREGETDPFIEADDTEAAVGADGRWLLTLNNPGLTSGRGYQGQVHYRSQAGSTNLLSRSFQFLGCG